MLPSCLQLALPDTGGWGNFIQRETAKPKEVISATLEHVCLLFRPPPPALDIRNQRLHPGMTLTLTSQRVSFGNQDTCPGSRDSLFHYGEGHLRVLFRAGVLELPTFLPRGPTRTISAQVRPHSLQILIENRMVQRSYQSHPAN